MVFLVDFLETLLETRGRGSLSSPAASLIIRLTSPTTSSLPVALAGAPLTRRSYAYFDAKISSVVGILSFFPTGEVNIEAMC